MRVAFVGVKRKYQELAPEYRDAFDRYHLELPFYYARDGKNDVTITTVDDPYNLVLFKNFLSEGALTRLHESGFVKLEQKFDVVVHWRKWFPELYRPEAVNVINCQDHSFGPEWQASARQAFREGKLYGILCFPTWHKRNLLRECPWLPAERALDGVTLGVDCDIYKPTEKKDPYQLLWASDPGRGIQGVYELALRLFSLDKRFKMHVCWPDYAKDQPRPMHPVFEFHRSMPNGPELWSLFDRCGVLPYTSTFPEPSSRAHRQAQAAGSLVLYPPDMGTPSELIGVSRGEFGETGVVAPVARWPELILDLIRSGKWKEIGQNARRLAESESWAVQAQRFNGLFKRILEERK